MKVGEIITALGDITINEGRATATVKVKNSGARPVQIGSHFHFYEVNAALLFDREKTYGFRLDIPAGTAVRFEPGEEKKVELVEIGGRRKIMGANGAVNNYLDERSANKEGK